MISSALNWFGVYNGDNGVMNPRFDRMKRAEEKLMELARNYGDRSPDDYSMKTVDTPIPQHVLPLRQTKDDAMFNLHSIQVQSHGNASNEEVPLVLMHGYMNAAAYFYQNLVGLSSYFQTIHSLDMMGWGLSSRPKFQLRNTDKEDNRDDISLTESFFVESLEAWRQHNKIPKMILAGHSMGGYMAVAYCEKYPQHVDKLVLLSPVGVPEESSSVKEQLEARRQTSWRFWFLTGFAKFVFNNMSFGSVVRTIPTSMSESFFSNYVERRLPSISNSDEQKALTEYLVANSDLPGSGEHCLNKVLTPTAHGKRPVSKRIPNLQVSDIAMLYGESDWMDASGGIEVQKTCDALRAEATPAGKAVNSTNLAPSIKVYQVQRAGHLLMLENWRAFNSAVILGAGGSPTDLPPSSPLPNVLRP